MRIRAPGFRIQSSYDVSFSDCGRYLATAGRRVTVWDVAARVVLHRNSLLRHPSTVAFAPDGTSYVVKAARAGTGPWLRDPLGAGPTRSP